MKGLKMNIIDRKINGCKKDLIFEIDIGDCGEGFRQKQTFHELNLSSIFLHANDAEQLMQALIELVTHAYLIGFEIYPNFFQKCFAVLFKTLKEVSLKNQIMCLKYFNTYLQRISTISEIEEYYLTNILKCLSKIWKQAVLLLKCQFIDLENAKILKNISNAIVLEILFNIKKSHFMGRSFNNDSLSNQIYSTIISIFNVEKWYKLKNNVALLNAFRDLIFYLQAKHKIKYSLTKEKLILFQEMSFEYPNALRLLFWTLILKNEKEDMKLLTLDYFFRNFFCYLEKEKKNYTEYNFLSECASGFLFLQNAKHFKDDNLIDSNGSLEILKNKFSQAHKISLKHFVNNILHKKATEDECIIYLEISICISLLSIDVFRKTFDTNDLQCILKLIGYPIKKYFETIKKKNLCFDVSADLLLASLRTLCNFEIGDNNIIDTIANLLKLELCTNSCRFLPQQRLDLYREIIKFLLKNNYNCEMLIVSVFENVNLDSKEFNAIFTKMFCYPHIKEHTKMLATATEYIPSQYNKNTNLLSNLIIENLLPITPMDIKQITLQCILKEPKIDSSFNQNYLNNDTLWKVISELLNAPNLNPALLKILVIPFELKNNFLTELMNTLLKCVIFSLEPKTFEKHIQKNILTIITVFCNSGSISPEWIFYFLKLTLFFLVHPNSLVLHEAIVVAIEICHNQQISPVQLWNWYKKDTFSLISRIAVLLYLKKGVRLFSSLRHIIQILGFTCVQEFICKYYRLFMTLVTPFCVKETHCRGLLIDISKNTRKPISQLFVASFLRIYTHVFLTEESLCRECVEIVSKCTSSGLCELLNVNIKQTVSEVLIHFHRSSDYVKHIFGNLLTESKEKLYKEFISFIADRFLGILTYLKACLADPNIEKPIKKEALCSLGKIIKSVGTEYVTKFRFKIIAMLDFIMSLEDTNLYKICLKIWIVFLNTISIKELGPSIAHVAASLQRFLPLDKNEVNRIYDYLIIKNGTSISRYLKDIYFLQNDQAVMSAIRERLSLQNKSLKMSKSEILAELEFFFDQISSPNIQIHIYGLVHLRNLICSYRETINQLVSNQIHVDPVFGKIIECLALSCYHEDSQLQLASAKCIGELGAIDPSYLPSKNTLEQNNQITLSVLTDDFAITALTELCRIYQFQKGTKYVDNFSLAIQETLSVCGISPKQNKKLHIWESMPLCIRQIMIPFLTSCYTTSKRKCEYDGHPIFTSNICRNFSEWAFVWATRLIDFVKEEDTNHLLNSYKPSMKRDRNILALFFPYVLIHALLDSTDAEMELIYEEFETVFNFCQLNKKFQLSYDASISKEFLMSWLVVNQFNKEMSQKICSDKFFGDASESMTQSCSKFCFELLDFLQQWLHEWFCKNPSLTRNVKATDHQYDRVQKFLEKFNKHVIARANFNVGEFTRTLIYLEDYIAEDSSNRLQEQISFLIQTYSKIGDADSVEGAVYIKQSNLSLSEEILFNKMCDRPHETMNCYEQLISLNSDRISQEHIKGLIDCYVCMETTETALLIANGLWQKFSSRYVDNYFKECKLELFWRLGRYDDLNSLLKQSLINYKRKNWSVQCARTFNLFRLPINLDEIECEGVISYETSFTKWIKKLDEIRYTMLSTMRNCLATKQLFSYSRFYDDAIKFHLLRELENSKFLLVKIFKYLFQKDFKEKGSEICLLEIKHFFNDWELRLEIVQPIARVLGPILHFRRNLLIEMKQLVNKADFKESGKLDSIINLFDLQIGNIWMQNVGMYRDMGSLQQAHISLLKAELYAPKTLYLEKIKLLWKMGNQTASFKLIEENLGRIETKCEKNLQLLEEEDHLLYAETKFLQAIYSAESMSICAELNLRYFKEAISGNKNSEKCHIHLAQYMEKILNSYSEEQKNSEKGRKITLEIMLSYAKSLRCGIENIYQSLPRLLTFWFDYTAESGLSLNVQQSRVDCDPDAALSITKEELCRKMNDLINNCSNILPISIFYTTFSQLLSRICHPSNDVFSILRTIVVKLIVKFPHQSLWKLLPIFKSFNNHKVKRCKLILTDSRLDDISYQKLLLDFNMLTERLIELTNKEVVADHLYTVSALVKQLPKLFNDPNFSRILLPFEKFMHISFPIATHFRCDQSLTKAINYKICSSTHIPTNPFPHKQVFIFNINEEVTVLRSAAKPKKIVLQCDDSQNYTVMVKPKDDLRRDFRLMEFNGLVKRYLHLDIQARHRRLRIRTYAIVPFNEECGLVEWLPNLNSFRSICTSIYRKHGLGFTDRNLRKYLLPKSDPIEAKRRVFLDSLLPNHPPVFHEWFRQRFPIPSIWYEARTSFIKTISVMSIVGYILGLGDRHGENILFDEISGDAVHVDFNCLFNQGELFTYPELVPFRLTHNMTFAMGPLKFEGIFRKCCEITLRILNHASSTLMSVLRPFVYDLAVHNRNQTKYQYGGELTDPKAMVDVQRIDDRLQGYVKKTAITSMPLSVEGHINFLISEATNIDNLAAMYIGWGAYL